MKHIRFKYQISTEGITPPPFYCINHCKSVDYPPLITQVVYPTICIVMYI